MKPEHLDLVRRCLEDSADVKKRLLALHLESITRAGGMIIESLRGRGKVMLCGNGGSAADAQHIAAELLGRFRMERDPLPAMALTTNSSVLTAIANDYGYDAVFARQVRGLGRQGDVLVAISTSGRSANVLAAAEAARDRGVGIIALTGQGGGLLRERSDVTVDVPSTDVARIQEAHILVGHTWCDLVEKELCV